MKRLIILSLLAFCSVAFAQNSQSIYAWPTTGTDTYSVTITGAGTTYTSKWWKLKFVNANTGASTLAVNGGAAVGIKKKSSGAWVDLVSGDINAGDVCFVSYDGTRWQIELTEAAAVGITDINGQSDATQIITTNGTGTDVGVSSSGGTHTIHLPTASGTVRGVLSTADWTTFNNHWSLASGGALTGPNTLTGTSSNTIKAAFGGLGTTQTDGAGLWLSNTTAATAGSQQISPSIVWEGQGWKTNSTAASQSVMWAMDMIPVQGTANPAGRLQFKSSVNGGAKSVLFQFDSEGNHRFGTAGALMYPSSTAGTVLLGAGGLTIQTAATSNVDGLGIMQTQDGNISQRQLTFRSSISGTTGSNTNTAILIEKSYNFTGGTWTAAGLDYNPTLTSVTGLSNYFLRSSSGLAGIGTRTPTAVLHVKSYGTTTDEAIRVDDSGGTNRDLGLSNGTRTFTSDAGSTPFRFQTSTATQYVGFNPSSTSSVVFGNASGTISLGIHSTASDYLWTNAVSGMRMTRLTLSNASGNDTNAPFIRRSGTNGTGQLQINAGDGAGPNEIRIKFLSDFTGLTSGTTTLIGVDQTFTQSSGTHSLNFISLTPTINTTGTYAGLGSGYTWNPTLTSTTGFTNYAYRSSSGLWGVNTLTPNNSAQLEISSTTRGFLPPRMTGTQAEAISSPAEGLMVYSTDGSGATITTKGWWGYDGSTWVKLN
jgi:hypothetical protein